MQRTVIQPRSFRPTRVALRYIHDNPVKAGLVDDPWEYRYSSARDYMKGERGLLEIEFLEYTLTDGNVS